MKNYFQRSVEFPYHISIGAIVVNKEQKIACHYFKTLAIPDFGEIKDLYILMRETIEPNETIEHCLARGMQEEFGIKASLKSYVGSIVSLFPLTKTGPIVEKTTLYFLCDLISIDEKARSKDDPESGSTILWLAKKDAIAKMKDQRHRLKREDADESAILERINI